MKKKQDNLISDNKKARFNYEFIEKIEAGLMLTGNEVKSIRAGRIHLRDAFARIINEECWLFNCHITPYNMAHKADKINPTRDRKLLLHKRQLKKWIGKVQEKGLTLVPTKMYFSGQYVKVQIALAKAKKIHDKRQQLKEKAIQKDVRQQFKRR
tara:strand:+ start:74 stop:535 length:462 start_codon:yes stop_codon:yes gene_type:complete